MSRLQRYPISANLGRVVMRSGQYPTRINKKIEQVYDSVIMINNKNETMKKITKNRYTELRQLRHHESKQ